MQVWGYVIGGVTLGLTMLEHHHLGVSHLRQVHAVAVTHLLWGRRGLQQGQRSS